jgi:hypothetical protein
MISIRVKVEVNFKGMEDRIRAAAGRGLRKVATAAHGEWQTEAGRRLSSTRRRYQDALKLTQIDDEHATIHLEASDKSTNWLVNALEYGAESFDMKPSRLKGHAARHWSGYHRTLPGMKKKLGQPFAQEPPFVDIPIREKGSPKEGKPSKFRRMHSGSSGWIHPGFKPLGKKGPGPMRPHVAEFIKEHAPKIFRQELEREIDR